MRRILLEKAFLLPLQMKSIRIFVRSLMHCFVPSGIAQFPHPFYADSVFCR